MSKIAKYLIAAALIIALAIPTGMSIVKANKIPTFDIVSVVPDEVVTIQTYDFPADKAFDVIIGPYGTYGITGAKVAEQNSGKGGSFTATYEIPAEFKSVSMLSIRLEDRVSGYYAYNWFQNSPLPVATPAATSPDTNTPVPPEQLKHPSFIISTVTADQSIQVDATDFPENENFDVIMGAYGTFGIGGEKVTTQKTGSKGEFKATYAIPASLKGAYLIAVRMESTDSDYFAFNYFYNATYAPAAENAATAAETTGTIAATPESAGATPTEEAAYAGYPYFSVTTVKKDTTVMIEAENLPEEEVFDVYMSDFFLANSSALPAGKLESGKGGKATASFSIPEQLKGVHQISIRLSGEKTGYFSYNYFFNTDFPVPTAVPTQTMTTTAATPEATATAVEASPSVSEAAPTGTAAVEATAAPQATSTTIP